MMAEYFLTRLLTTENRVKFEEGSQDCIICLDRYGTLSCESGIEEFEVRLPCNHTVGSAVGDPFPYQCVTHANQTP